MSLPRLPRSTILAVTLGPLFVIFAYIGTIAILLVTVDAPRFSTHFLDDVAFRAAWITVAQVPLIYLLSVKWGPLNILGSISYERINWIHRWVGRTLFLSASTHMGLMMQSISFTELFKSSDKAMSVIRNGAGAYGLLFWIAISSILPLRRRCHRMFYINHYISTLAFLWFVLQHVPSYARPFAYLALSFVLLDKLLFSIMFLSKNISIKPGQHFRVYIPALGKFEMHPFTPATCSDLSNVSEPLGGLSSVEEHVSLMSEVPPSMSDMTLMIRAHKGFTRRLADYHLKWLSLPCPNSSKSSSTLTAYLDGPYGDPPRWQDYEALVFVVTSTGVSFSLAVLDYLEQLWLKGEDVQTRKIRLVWIVRHLDPNFEATVLETLARRSILLRDAGVRLAFEVHTTCPHSQVVEVERNSPFSHQRRPSYFRGKLLRIINPDDIIRGAYEHKEVEREPEHSEVRSSASSDGSATLIDERERQSISELEEVPLHPQERRRSSYLPLLFHQEERAQAKPRCNCAEIQQQYHKLKSQPYVDFVTRRYGSRPDVSKIMKGSIAPFEEIKAMVAVCANEHIAKTAKNVVAEMNIDYAFDSRARCINIFTEGFS
ncbi:hypothetical protein BU24DRAFT_349805 [Aaosphaeria arxii CBS 175.79]|uniref:FAD-binding FR-type domain-containing protein n=1 Tax=Aaosphaeria arxii CBS 175.79 TaxID=1450172 RepID=A0A6A5XKY0_9PLEO|nr:uncharacterized protein BU24DRAFT_349805 [Aaosphaeria arxii CBS 175.79]KAF2013593.1 hypothetical protein BU24DRAFT_349805 [Aaosphaeria arxii CBS 175.79]